MLDKKFLSILDNDIKDLVLDLHPALQEDVINIITDLINIKSVKQINREVRLYLKDLPLDYLAYDNDEFYNIY